MFFKRNKKVQIISLGHNCIPRTVLTRAGIKPRKLQGELTYPFDLAITGVFEITKNLKNDFKEFLYNLNYRKDEGFWVKEPDCIKFVHDKKFKFKDKEKFIKTYEKRIENFRKEIKNPIPILFIQIVEKDEDVQNLYNELARLRGDYPFKLAIIDTQDKVNFEKAYILKLPFPSEEYRQNWWKKEYYNSPEGIAFEKSICDFCLKIKEELNNI